MTTNKPEVVAWYFPSSMTTLPVVSLNAGNGNGQSLIRLSDYEALQAELETMKKVAYGNIELLERNEALQAECEELRMDAKRLDWIVSEGVIVSREQIREVFLRNGFTIKDGRDDLADYVYAAAYELLATTAKKAERCE